MLGREDRLQAHPRRGGDEVDGAPAPEVDSGLVGDQPDRVSREQREPLTDEHVQSGEDPVGGGEHRLARQSIVRRRLIGGRPTRGTGIGHDRRLEELGAGRRREPDPQISDARGAAAVRMDAVRQDDDVAPGRRIDPQRGAGEPEMTDRALRKERRHRLRERRGDVPAERARPAALGCHLPHRAHRGGLEDAMPVERPAIQQHPADPREVGGRREHPGMTGDSAEQASPRIVNLAPQEVAVGEFRRRDP